MRATTRSLWTSSLAQRGYNTCIRIPPGLRGAGRNPGYRTLVIVLRSASARGDKSGCSRSVPGPTRERAHSTKKRPTSFPTPASRYAANPFTSPLLVRFIPRGRAKTDGKLESILDRAPCSYLKRAIPRLTMVICGTVTEGRMQLSDQRLNDILSRLQQGQDVFTVSREEWMSIAMELRQLRLRTSSQSRTATALQSATRSS
jgi:hypothetical protein